MICPPQSPESLRLHDLEYANYVENYTENEILNHDSLYQDFDTGARITYGMQTRGRRRSVVPVDEVMGINRSDYLSPLIPNTYTKDAGWGAG